MSLQGFASKQDAFLSIFSVPIFAGPRTHTLALGRLQIFENGLVVRASQASPGAWEGGGHGKGGGEGQEGGGGGGNGDIPRSAGPHFATKKKDQVAVR